MDCAPAVKVPWVSGQTLQRDVLSGTRWPNTFCRNGHSNSIFTCCYQGITEVRLADGLKCVMIDVFIPQPHDENHIDTENVNDYGATLGKSTGFLVFMWSFLEAWKKNPKTNETDKFLSYRMYPVVSMNGRILLDRAVVIGGYKFPKKVGLRCPAFNTILKNVFVCLHRCLHICIVLKLDVTKSWCHWRELDELDDLRFQPVACIRRRECHIFLLAAEH